MKGSGERRQKKVGVQPEGSQAFVGESVVYSPEPHTTVAEAARRIVAAEREIARLVDEVMGKVGPLEEIVETHRKSLMEVFAERKPSVILDPEDWEAVRAIFDIRDVYPDDEGSLPPKTNGEAESLLIHFHKLHFPG